MELLGTQDDFLASGSDDGRLFIWNRRTGKLLNLLDAADDHASILSLACHPSMPMLATSGGESVVKVWTPEVRRAWGSDWGPAG